MINIYIIIILVAVGYLFSRVFQGVFRPYSFSQLKKSKEDKIYTNNKEFSFESLQNQVKKRVYLVEMNEDLEIDLNKKLNRLNIDLKATDIRRYQLLSFLATLLVAVLVRFILGSTPALILAGFSLYAWRYPIIHINQQVRARDEAIKTELPEMYAILYYAYKRSSAVNLTSKIQSYIRDCPELFYKEMMLFVEDSREGEINALRQFKKRVPIGVVTRFCDIMETRLTGNDNTSVMYNFKKEMDDRRSEREIKLLDDLSKKLERISTIGIMVPVGMILIVYFAGQIMSSTQGF